MPHPCTPRSGRHVLPDALCGEPDLLSCRKSRDASARSQSRKVTIFGRLAVAFGQTIQ